MIRTISDTIKRLGWTSSALYLASRALHRISNGNLRLIRYYFVAQPVPPPGSHPSALAAGTTVREVQADDAIAGNFPRPPEVISRRYAEGAVCLAATPNGEFAGFLWLMLGPYDEDEVRGRFIPLPAEHAAWDFDVYVAPSFRMSRTFARLWFAANDYLHKRNVAWTISRISAFNTDSLRAHSGLGGMRIASATFICLSPLQITLASVRPWLHVSFTPGSRPELRLRVPIAKQFERTR